MRRASFTPFIFFFITAFVLLSMTVVRADMKGQQNQKDIAEKIEQLENRIRQLKVETQNEKNGSLWDRFSVNLESFKSEAVPRLAGLKERVKGLWTGLEDNMGDFAVDAKEFYHAVKKKYFRIAAEIKLEEMVQEKEEFENTVSADSLTRQKFRIFDEKVRMTRQKLYRLEGADVSGWEEARDEAELALSETRIIYQQFN